MAVIATATVIVMVFVMMDVVVVAVVAILFRIMTDCDRDAIVDCLFFRFDVWVLSWTCLRSLSTPRTSAAFASLD